MNSSVLVDLKIRVPLCTDDQGLRERIQRASHKQLISYNNFVSSYSAMVKSQPREHIVPQTASLIH